VGSIPFTTETIIQVLSLLKTQIPQPQLCKKKNNNKNASQTPTRSTEELEFQKGTLLTSVLPWLN